MSKIASRYTVALLELAIDEARVPFYRDQIALIHNTINKCPSLMVFLNHFLISKEEKKALIEEIFADHDNESVIKFLYVIIDHDRCNILDTIIDDFLKQSNAYLGILTGYVYSAYQLDEKQLKEIEDAVSIRLEKKVILENFVDQGLISGVKIVVDDNVIDGTLKNKISLLKNSLLSRGG